MVIKMNYGKRKRGSNFSSVKVGIVEIRTIWCHLLASNMHMSVLLRLHPCPQLFLKNIALPSTQKLFIITKNKAFKKVCQGYKYVHHVYWLGCYFVICSFLFGNVFAILFQLFLKCINRFWDTSTWRIECS